MTTMINYGLEELPGGLANPKPTQFEQTIPRQLVHRAAVSEVFLTDLHRTAEDAFQVGAQWPRTHCFFGPRAGAHDPMLLAETVRQATLALAHQMYGVPADAQFVWHETCHQVTEGGLRLDAKPADIVLTATAHEIRRRRTGVGGMLMQFDGYRDNRWVSSSSMRFSCVSPATYARLRGEPSGVVHLSTRMGSLVAPHLVGRDKRTDVVLAEAPGDNRWTIRVDRGHPVMFDHPVDHVPGMVVMEAARQAAMLALGWTSEVVVRMSFSFASYVEFNEPCYVVVDHVSTAGAGAGMTHVRFEQGERTVAEGDLELLAGGFRG